MGTDTCWESPTCPHLRWADRCSRGHSLSPGYNHHLESIMAKQNFHKFEGTEEHPGGGQTLRSSGKNEFNRQLGYIICY